MTETNEKTIDYAMLEKVIEPILHRWHYELADRYGQMPDEWAGNELPSALNTLAEENDGKIYLDDIPMIEQYVDDMEQELGKKSNKPNREMYDEIIDYLQANGYI